MSLSAAPPEDLVEAVAGHVRALAIDHECLAAEDFAEANQPRQWNNDLKKLSVLVPLHNERWTIGPLLQRVLASAPLPELEIIVVDDGSTDGSREVVEQMMRVEPRIHLVRHSENRGKGAAIRTALEYITGDVVIMQDADLEYDPQDYGKLLKPILEGHADAVFGSRFTGPERRVLLFWHSLGNKLLTLLCNALNDLNLTDMETCYKVVRADVLRELRLTSDSFTIEPELTTRLAQWGARIFEVPVSYRGRRLREGKKIRAWDGLKAIGEMLRCRFIDTRFTPHTGMYVLRSVERAHSYNRWLIQQIAPFLGRRVAEAGSGIGNMSQFLADREHLLLVDHDPIYVASLADRFQVQGNVRVLQCDLTQPDFERAWRADRLDTVFCSNVLEHLGPHQAILKSFYNALNPEGHCIIIVPAVPRLYNGLDVSLGHHRRYRADELRSLMEECGFEIVYGKQVCKLGALAWLINGSLLRRRRLTPRQMLAFDRCWPVTRWLDRVLPWSGMSLIMVGRKPAAQQPESPAERPHETSGYCKM